MQKALNENLKKMYPGIRERQTYLPRRWDRNQASMYLDISNDGLTVTFKNNSKIKEEKETSAVVRANFPIPCSIGFYYFEITIESGERGCLGIGLSRRDGALNRMPGWDQNCLGYHGDDGHFFSSCGHGTLYGPKFTTGDVIGCGFDTVLRQIFFTKNGEHLGVAANGITHIDDMYPTVGMKNPGEKIRANFGLHPFKFDFEAHKRQLFEKKIEMIDDIPMPPELNTYMHRIIESFLERTGAVNTLKVFNADANPDVEMIEKRKEIYNLILNGGNGYKIETKIRENFPTLLDESPDVHVYLMCMRFIDLAATLKPFPPQDKPEADGVTPKFPSSSALVTSSKHTVSNCSPSSSSTCSSIRNPNKRTRPGDDSRGKRGTDGTPAKKSPMTGRRKNAEGMKVDEDGVDCKNGHSSSNKQQEKLIRIEDDMMISEAAMEKMGKNEVEKIRYLINLAREIYHSCSLCDKSREIVEVALSMLRSNRKLCDPYPLSFPQRTFIANKVMAAIFQLNKEPQYSELRAMFMMWKGIQDTMEKKEFPPASFPLAKIFMESNGTQLYANKTILAPMVRAGRTPLRVLSLKYGADLVYTEEIVDQKLLKCQRILNTKNDTIDYNNYEDVILRIAPEERGKVILQIGTNNGESAAKVAKLIGNDVAGIDVNMGCPKPFSIHSGMGAALLKETDKIKDILTSLKAASKVPISCKIRVLDDRNDTLNLVREIEKCGVSAIGVHGRRRDERQPDPCRIDEIREIVRTVGNIPIITNGVSGEIEKFEDIEKWRNETEASSIMIARKALETPSIFRKEGVLTKFEDIENFLDYACQYNEPYTTAKYVVQRLLGSDQEHDPRGKSTVAAGSLLEICRAYNKQDVYEFWKKERLRKSCKRKECVDSDGIFNIDVSFPLKRLKDAQANVATPKQIIHEYCVESKFPKPFYQTYRRDDKRYMAILSIGGQKFRSTIAQVNVRMAEQVAALAALYGLGIRGRLRGEWEEDGNIEEEKEVNNTESKD
ncbi:unnamed protein product [Caenorhabditis bovis]|uniref:B30.2/SPRY domain-containing protein n=1 Tax=Caenorhabditis bovis TaxID=2654633 RepID=A0A8S1F8K1_9PELO|nr:unnamed protein product [Caenorhabditis bovis]